MDSAQALSLPPTQSVYSNWANMMKNGSNEEEIETNGIVNNCDMRMINK